MKIPELPNLIFPRYIYLENTRSLHSIFPRNFHGIYQEDTGKFSLIFSQYKYHENTRTSQPDISRIYLPGKYQCIKFNVSPEFSWYIPEKYRELFPDIILVVSTREIPGTTNLVFPWCVFQENTRIALPIFTWSFPGVNTRKSESLNA